MAGANSLCYGAASLDKKDISWNEERTGDRRDDKWQEEAPGGVLRFSFKNFA